MSAYGQETLLEKEVKPVSIETTGPNLRTFSHTYIGFGFYALQSEGSGSDIRFWHSGTFHVGKRFKFKITDYWAWGVELEYFRQDFELKQNSDKMFPNNILHDQERLVLDNGGLALYNRINFSRRGNIIGNFLDIGGYINGSFSIKHIAKDEVDDPAYGSERVISIRKKLNYAERYQYGIKARLGFNRYVVTANYRLSDIINSSIPGISELSRLSVGLELGIH